MQDLAEQAGDTGKVGELTRKLEELEERAEELDKQRSKGLSAIRCVQLHLCNNNYTRRGGSHHSSPAAPDSVIFPSQLHVHVPAWYWSVEQGCEKV